MRFLRICVFTVLLFALHFGSGAFSHSGWAPAILPAAAILAVWLGKEKWVMFSIGPAALLVDILYAQQLPITTVSVLSSWGMVTLVQRHWLTNHSSIALIGLTIVGFLTAHAVHLTMQSIAHVSGLLWSDVNEAWAGWQSVSVLIIETTVTFALGLLSRAFIHSFGRRFLYATR